ncbi:hypothetical protein KEM54_002227 [Ascosphaera aggregata]|nr:hypothetical protein KEM54_002227 [Ascosphaera aggregata]
MVNTNIPGSQAIRRSSQRLSDEVRSTFGRGDEGSDDVQKHYGDTDHSYENTHKSFDGEQYQSPDYYQDGVKQGRSAHHPAQETAQNRFGQQHPQSETINAGGQPARYSDSSQFGQQPPPQQGRNTGFQQHPQRAGVEQSRFQPQQGYDEPPGAHPQQSYTGQQRPQYGDEGQRGFDQAQRGAEQNTRKKSFMGRVHDKLASL